MAVLHLRAQLDRLTTRRLFLVLALLNAGFAAMTGLFILLWARVDGLSPLMQQFTRHIVVQGHLATENVVAAWYSSMLLFAVAGMAWLAWVVDRRLRAGSLSHGWLLVGAIFTLLSLDEIGSLHEGLGMLPLLDGRGLGWVNLLAAPILAVGVFLLAFGWSHVRRVRVAFALMAVGTGLFLSNPVVETIEMAMIHGKGATAGTWQRMLHDILQVVEEGGLELFGTLCFLGATWSYVASRTGEVVDLFVTRRAAVMASRLTCVLLAGGVFAGNWVSAHLPRGDIGLVQNWFPATAWMLVALAALAQVSDRPRVNRVAGVCALIVSAAAVAGPFGSGGWWASRASWLIPVSAVFAAALALEVLLGSYLFSRSPRSSTASPTLRRPRPNPS